MSLRKERVNRSKIYCCVPQCSSYYTKDISFHKFPLENKHLLAVWLKLFRIGKRVSKHMRVCSKHFKETDFHITNEFSKRRRLKAIAVPTENLPKGSHDRIVNETLSKKREKRRNRREVEKNSLAETIDVHHVDDDISKKICESEAAEMLLELARKPLVSPFQHNFIKTFEDKAVQVNTYEEYQTFDVSNVIDNDHKLRMLTGLQNSVLLHVLVSGLIGLQNTRSKFDTRKRVILTLMRIKLDLTFTALAAMFKISNKSAQTYFHETLHSLAVLLRTTIRFPSKQEIQQNMPLCFSKFLDTRIVLDCTEVEIQKSSCLKCRIRSYSFYKGRHTCKVLIGVAPSGLITYVSKAYGGRASDKSIVVNEKLLSQLSPGDGVMVDKGFLIDNECKQLSLKLIRPPFLRKKSQLTSVEAKETVEIARARVHIERIMQRIKLFRVVRNVIPWSLLSQLDDIMIVIVALTNFSNPILSENKY